jgi:hypothetical protein
MNRFIKEQTVKIYCHETPDELRDHLYHIFHRRQLVHLGKDALGSGFVAARTKGESVPVDDGSVMTAVG